MSEDHIIIDKVSRLAYAELRVGFSMLSTLIFWLWLLYTARTLVEVKINSLIFCISQRDCVC